MTDKSNTSWEAPFDDEFQDEWAKAVEAGEDWHVHPIFRGSGGDIAGLHDQIAEMLQGAGSDTLLKMQTLFWSILRFPPPSSRRNALKPS